MRRYPVVKLILAVIALSLIAVPANAAAPRSVSSADSAPWAYLGSVCRTVHSNVHHKTGVICIEVAVQNEVYYRAVRAFASFKSASGKLKGVTARHLVLYLSGRVAESGAYSGKATGRTGNLTTRNRNLWDGGPNSGAAGPARAGLFDACMIWPDGARACTGAHWLYSKVVRA
jgi:hypothetical protein